MKNITFTILRLRIYFKKVFMRKEKKKVINILTAFFIFHKSDVKTFLKWILKQYHTALVNMTLHILIKSIANTISS